MIFFFYYYYCMYIVYNEHANHLLRLQPSLQFTYWLLQSFNFCEFIFCLFIVEIVKVYLIVVNLTNNKWWRCIANIHNFTAMHFITLLRIFVAQLWVVYIWGWRAHTANTRPSKLLLLIFILQLVRKTFLSLNLTNVGNCFINCFKIQ